MTNRKIHLYVNMMQALVGICIFLLFCFASFLVGGKDLSSLWPIMGLVAKASVLPVAVYVLNYGILIPKLFFRGRKVWFFMADLFLIAGAICIALSCHEVPDIGMPDEDYSIKVMAAVVITNITLYLCMIALAMGVRYMLRWYDERNKLEEERRRNTEAELDWLKNQLNPHFLFNTLNNISSLVQIDADKAQDCIGQLSELLRYALYESSSRKVRLTAEIEFMNNYINLMSLRCSDKTEIIVRFDSFDETTMISPLIFISLIENAFKHGTSSHKDSFITIDLGMNGGDLVFSCVNSMIERTKVDRSGSGIGIDNMNRRLELLYPGSYSYEQSVEDEAYVVIVRIFNIKGNE